MNDFNLIFIINFFNDFCLFCSYLKELLFSFSFSEKKDDFLIFTYLNDENIYININFSILENNITENENKNEIITSTLFVTELYDIFKYFVDGCSFTDIKYYNLYNYYFIDLTFFNIIIPLIILIFMYILVIFFQGKFLRLISNTILQRILENKLEFIFNLVKQQIGIVGYIFIVMFFSIFFLILFLNLLSILPFGIALTSHLILILYLSLVICIGIFINGIYVNNLNFFKIFMPKSPLLMLPLLILIELFSYIIRMFSLAIRLGANIMAGHTLIFIVSNFILVLMSFRLWYLLIGIFLICIIMILELCVACLQAYVFLILVLIYMNDVYNINH